MKKNIKKSIILLIDGNAIVHRSFHGIPVLKTKDGIQVNAVYGFTSTILSVIHDFHPEYLAVAWDVGKKTFRNDKYPEYKATRVKAPDELYAQFPLVKEVCAELNIPQFGVKNYEADDVIGTISAKISNIKYQISNKIQNSNVKNQKTNNQQLKVIIVTGDMDTLQLVNEDVNVYSVSRGIKKAEIFNEEKVKEKYGFEAKYLVDYKGLRGDPSDNIPGVSGVGEKTASALIKQFNTIEKLYDYLEAKSQNVNCKMQISKRVKQLLLDNKKQALLSKDLATIRCDVLFDFKLQDAKVSDYDPKKARKLFEKFDFKSLIKRLPEYKPNHNQNTLF